MNIELPKDAEGREIPLDTKALYGKDGEGLDVRHFEFSPFSGKWIIAALKGGPCNWTGVYRSPQNVHLEKPAPPDSWEKLEEDLDRCIEADCVSLGVSLVPEDIKQRIRKLRGED